MFFLQRATLTPIASLAKKSAMNINRFVTLISKEIHMSSSKAQYRQEFDVKKEKAIHRHWKDKVQMAKEYCDETEWDNDDQELTDDQQETGQGYIKQHGYISHEKKPTHH